MRFLWDIWISITDLKETFFRSLISINHPGSWCVKLISRFWERIYRFLWCTMMWSTLDHWSWTRSSQRNALYIKTSTLWPIPETVNISITTNQNSQKYCSFSKLGKKEYPASCQVPLGCNLASCAKTVSSFRSVTEYNIHNCLIVNVAVNLTLLSMLKIRK